MMYGRKNVGLDPYYPHAKFEQNLKTFLPQFGRHGRHAFEKPLTQNLCILEQNFFR